MRLKILCDGESWKILGFGVEVNKPSDKQVGTWVIIGEGIKIKSAHYSGQLMLWLELVAV